MSFHDHRKNKFSKLLHNVYDLSYICTASPDFNILWVVTGRTVTGGFVSLDNIVLAQRKITPPINKEFALYPVGENAKTQDSASKLHCSLTLFVIA